MNAEFIKLKENNGGTDIITGQKLTKKNYRKSQRYIDSISNNFKCKKMIYKKNKMKTVMFICVFSFITSCGGVIGNIEIYEFEGVTSDELSKAISSIYKNNPEFIKKDTVWYGHNHDNTYYFDLHTDKELKFRSKNSKKIT